MNGEDERHEIEMKILVGRLHFDIGNSQYPKKSREAFIDTMSFLIRFC